MNSFLDSLIKCHLKKQKKEIALIENTNLSFLRNFRMPETKIALSSDKIKKKDGFIYAIIKIIFQILK